MLATHLGGAETAPAITEIYPCNICGGRYASLIDLVNHRREHSESAELRCELCGEVFTAAENLIVHYQTHAIESIQNSQAEAAAAAAGQAVHAVDGHSHVSSIQPLLLQGSPWTQKSLAILTRFISEILDLRDKT